MSNKVKVTLEYVGSFRSTSAIDYRIVKLQNAVALTVPSEGGSITARVGDMLTEAQANDLLKQAEVTVIPKSR